MQIYRTYQRERGLHFALYQEGAPTEESVYFHEGFVLHLVRH